MIVTGTNGLYRYDLNDVVEVRGFHARTPKVAFVRKGRDMVNITGEKLHLNHVLHAVRAAERATGLGVWQFRLIPDVDAARYDLLIEPPRPWRPRRRSTDFVTAFDRALARGQHASTPASAPRRAWRRRGCASCARAGPSGVCRQEFARGRREIQHKWSALRPEWDDASRSEVVVRRSTGSRRRRCAS